MVYFCSFLFHSLARFIFLLFFFLSENGCRDEVLE